jgi:hypothetical protein
MQLFKWGRRSSSVEGEGYTDPNPGFVVPELLSNKSDSSYGNQPRPSMFVFAGKFCRGNRRKANIRWNSKMFRRVVFITRNSRISLLGSLYPKFWSVPYIYYHCSVVSIVEGLWIGRRDQARERTRKGPKAGSEVDNQSMKEGSPTYPRGRSVPRTHQATLRKKGLSTRNEAYIAPKEQPSKESAITWVQCEHTGVTARSDSCSIKTAAETKWIQATYG